MGSYGVVLPIRKRNFHFRKCLLIPSWYVPTVYAVLYVFLCKYGCCTFSFTECPCICAKMQCTSFDSILDIQCHTRVIQWMQRLADLWTSRSKVFLPNAPKPFDADLVKNILTAGLLLSEEALVSWRYCVFMTPQSASHNFGRWFCVDVWLWDLAWECWSQLSNYQL